MNLRAGFALLFALTVQFAVNGQNPFGPPPTPEQSENARRFVMKLLSERKIPKVQMEKASVREAIDFFCHKAGNRFNLTLKLGDEADVKAPPSQEKVSEVPAVPGIPGLPAGTSSRSSQPLITINRENISCREFLDELCKQSGLKWAIEYPGTIAIIPQPK